MAALARLPVAPPALVVAIVARYEIVSTVLDDPISATLALEKFGIQVGLPVMPVAILAVASLRCQRNPTPRPQPQGLVEPHR